MKNTKISLLNGLMLTIVLFTSTQTSFGMNLTPNGRLFPTQRKLVKAKMEETDKKLQILYKAGGDKNKESYALIRATEDLLNRCQNIYYDDRKYTNEEIDQLIGDERFKEERMKYKEEYSK